MIFFATSVRERNTARRQARATPGAYHQCISRTGKVSVIPGADTTVALGSAGLQAQSPFCVWSEAGQRFDAASAYKHSWYGDNWYWDPEMQPGPCGQEFLVVPTTTPVFVAGFPVRSTRDGWSTPYQATGPTQVWRRSFGSADAAAVWYCVPVVGCAG